MRDRPHKNGKQKEVVKELKGFEDFLRYERKRNGKRCGKPLSESTIREYLRFVDKMIERIGLDHGSGDIKDYYEKKLKAEHCNNGLVAICVALNHWCEYRKFDFRLPLHHVNEVPVEPLTEQEMNAMLYAAYQEDNLLFYTLFMALKETGQRIDDVTAIDIPDLDPDNLKIRMNISKLGGIEHIALISEKLADALRTYIDGQRIEPTDGSNALWISNQKKRINSYTVATNMKKCAVRAKVRKRIYPHLWRHSVITLAMERGVAPKTIMEMYKIRNIKTLVRYSHPSEDHMRTEFNRVVNGQNKEHGTPAEPISPKNTLEMLSRSDSKVDNGDRKARLRDRLEEAYVLGNIDRERYDEGLRRIAGLVEIDVNNKD